MRTTHLLPTVSLATALPLTSGCFSTGDDESAGGAGGLGSAGNAGDAGGGAGDSGAAGQAGDAGAAGSGGAAGGAGGHAGGAGSAGHAGSAGTAGAGGCAPADGDVCAAIPAFVGTQVVDGVGDEFCSVPAQVFGYADSEYQYVTNVAADTSLSQVTARLAWDASGLRGHLHVTDPNLLHEGVEPYDGDNVQLFIADATPSEYFVNSSYSGGANQLFMLPAVPGVSDPSAVVYPVAVGTPAVAFDFAGRVVADGYEVEFFWPWQNGAPSQGTALWLDLQVGVQDVAGAGRDFEYALALRDVVGGSNCETSASRNSPWCDYRHWCRPVLQ